MKKSEKQRRKVYGKKPCCGVCRHTGFVLHHFEVVDGKVVKLRRPRFICDKCGNRWSSDESGGEYMGNEIREVSPAEEALESYFSLVASKRGGDSERK